MPMEMGGSITPVGELSAVLIHADGTREDLGVLSSARPNRYSKKIRGIFRRFARWLGLAAAIALFAACGVVPPFVFGLVTTTGVTYMATDFTAGLASPRISGFNFHDSGTGTTAAAIGDTALQTPTGNARVAGVQSTPGSTNIYQTVATLPYTGAAAITEWGLLSAAASGTLWDHRVFAAINVLNGDSIQFIYKLTIPAGGT